MPSSEDSLQRKAADQTTRYGADQVLAPTHIGAESFAPQLNETSRKRTVSVKGMDDDDTADGYGGAGRGGRMSRQRKRCCASCGGEDLDIVSRSLGVTVATLSGWCDAFLDGGEASLATKPTKGEERESDRLKARLGEMLLERELLEQKIALPEGNSGPLAHRRSRR
jgi:transposase